VEGDRVGTRVRRGEVDGVDQQDGDVRHLPGEHAGRRAVHDPHPDHVADEADRETGADEDLAASGVSYDDPVYFRWGGVPSIDPLNGD
jgi:hypothetical protein